MKSLFLIVNIKYNFSKKIKETKLFFCKNINEINALISENKNIIDDYNKKSFSIIQYLYLDCVSYDKLSIDSISAEKLKEMLDNSSYLSKEQMDKLLLFITS